MHFSFSPSDTGLFLAKCIEIIIAMVNLRASQANSVGCGLVCAKNDKKLRFNSTTARKAQGPAQGFLLALSAVLAPDNGLQVKAVLEPLNSNNFQSHCLKSFPP